MTAGPAGRGAGRRRVAVVGAGITGLTAAYALTRKDSKLDVSLLESDDRAGGKIFSDPAGDFLFEAGPDSFVTNKPWGLELVRELGLAGELVPTNPKNKNLFVYTRGKLRRFPDGLMLMAPTKVIPFLLSDLVGFGSKIRMGMDYVMPRGDYGRDESLGDFARRRFGQAALDTIIGPVLAGIHAGDPDKLSLQSTFPQFREMERRKRSILLGMRAMAKERRRQEGRFRGLTLFMTLRGGLGRLPQALHDRLPPGTARLGCGVRSVEPLAGGGFDLRTQGGESLRADAVVLALPSNHAAGLLERDAALSRELAAIEFCSSGTASLAFEGKVLADRLDGFGFVVDRRARTDMMAATYSSTKFPGRVPPGKTLVRCFLGGVGREKAVEGSDGRILETVRRELRMIAGIRAEPVVSRVYRWPKANPQYNVGHMARIERIEKLVQGRPGIILAGSSYQGVGIPECVRSGREAARRILEAPKTRFSSAVC